MATLKYMNRPLGERQLHTLRSLKDKGPWYDGCGWVWDGPAGTRKILDALVARGLVRQGKHTLTNKQTGEIFKVNAYFIVEK